MSEYDVCRLPGEESLEDARVVRRAVFVEEQGVSEAEEWDGKDSDAVHYVVYVDGTPVGTARLRTPDPEVGKAERVAVLKRVRGQGVGTLLMDCLEREARDQGCRRMHLHAQTAVEEFYRTIGYETTSDEFDEAGIPHVEMEKRLDAGGYA